ncbi:MAG: hypothetical protein FWH28_09225, partial [Clostridiales bacterium]|nr:hypothetical protein [Clostridiales bacterium]
MFGTNERFNLIRASYARSGSNTFISEDFYKLGQLQLGNNWTGTWLSLTDYLFDMKLLINGAPTAYTYFADAGSLKLSACCAEVEVALTDRSHFRVRGENAGLRLELRSATAGNGAKACRGFYSLPDGSGWEGDFGRYGKLFIKAITGNYTVTTLFDEEKNAYSLVRIDFMPDAETGEFDAAIHDYREALLPFGEYEDFDEIVENNYAEFEEFRKIYRAPASGYEEMTKYAEWMIWSHRTKAIGQFKQPHILYQNAWTCTAAPWQQSYNAMPMLCDPAEAWRLICLMFLYQVESSGRIPGMVSYINPPQAGNQSAFQGFALEFLIRKLGEDFITADEEASRYPNTD